MLESDLLTPEMVEKLLFIKRGTLANWRSRGIGPAYHKVCGKILYSRSDIEEWFRSCKVRTFDQAG